MSKPDETMLKRSMAFLTDMWCLTSKPSGGAMALTPRGQLFNELPFDPRMSNFVVSACEHDVAFLEPAAEVAAILTAPGTIFFMGGKDRAEKLMKQSRISESAARYESDLLFLRAVYRDWFESGMTDAKSGRCTGCNRKANGYKGCTYCRKSIANERSLNNKILSVVQRTTEEVSRTIRKTLRQRQASPSKPADPASQPSEIDLGEVHGKCLAQCFFDQICQVILPTKPDAGVYLLEANEKGSLDNMSAISQRVSTSNSRENSLYIAMTIKQIPSGEYKVEQLHRVSLDWVPEKHRDDIDRKAFRVEPCYVKYGVAFEYKRKLELHFLRWSKKYREQLLNGQLTPRGPMPRLEQIQKIETEDFGDYVVCVYDERDHALYVYSPKRYAGAVVSIAAVFLHNEERTLLEFETNEVLGRGVSKRNTNRWAANGAT